MHQQLKSIVHRMDIIVIFLSIFSFTGFHDHFGLLFDPFFDVILLILARIFFLKKFQHSRFEIVLDHLKLLVDIPRHSWGYPGKAPGVYDVAISRI